MPIAGYAFILTRHWAISFLADKLLIDTRIRIDLSMSGFARFVLKIELTAEARRAQNQEFLIKEHSELCVLSGHEKKFKNDENAKIGLNEIKYLQVLIFAKIDFFSRPASLW
jgi:hypothetical protein